MKKQFFRVKQLADQTFLRAEKSEILNHEELQLADQKIEFLRGAITAITKKIAPSGPLADVDKLLKKTFEYQLGTTFLEEGKPNRECQLFQKILKESGSIEHQLARDYAEHEMKVEELVVAPFQTILENEFPNILKQKHNLRKYCLDKDSASNRYHATGKETLRDDMEEADTKVEQSRDALATEMFNVLAKENEFSEYILQFLKLQRSYHESALKNLENVIPQLEKKIGDSPVRRVFGTSLKEHLRITGKRIAYPLEICITALTEYGMQEEGLFRVAASTSKVKRLKSSIDSGCFSLLIPEYRDVHILASLLKLYLRELPEPLLTFHLHKEWLDATQVPDNRRLDVVKDIIAKLPQENRDNLSYLFQFLSKLTKHTENKMSASNIAIVLSPNLLWNKHENLNVNIGNCVTINMLVELFIKEVEALFPEDASKYVTLPEILHYEDYLNNFRASNSNLDACMDSPRPNTRKKKSSAPVPPSSSNKPDHEFPSVKMSPGQSPTSKPAMSDKSPSLLPTSPRTNEMPRKVLAVKDNISHIAQKPVSVQPATQKPDKLSIVKEDRATMTDNFVIKPANKIVEQKFTTSVVHKVNQPSIQPDKTRFDSDDIQIRRKDPSTKPEIPARPSSLSVRSSAEADAIFRKTQCSVYSVANKQQPSIINIHDKKEIFQPGHDNQISEKEKFLGHRPESVNNDINSNGAKDSGSGTTFPSGDVGSTVDATKKIRSTEQLNDTSEKFNCDNNNGNQKSSHTRARSDGGVIDLDKGGNVNAQFSSRSLNKPTQPPPPPPGL